MQNNVKDSVEAVKPGVKRRIDSITGVDGPLNIGYFSGDPAKLGYADAPNNPEDVDSMHINTNTSQHVFRMDSYDWPQRMVSWLKDEKHVSPSVLGTVYHEASHIKFAQRFDTLSTDNFQISVRRGNPSLYLLNEGTAMWVQHETGETLEPRPDVNISHPDLLRYQIELGDRDVYDAGYNLVEPILDSLGYREGITRMIQRPLPRDNELHQPSTYHKRILHGSDSGR